MHAERAAGLYNNIHNLSHCFAAVSVTKHT